MPPVVFVILNAIQAAIAAAPRVKEIVESGKQMISSLFTAKLITIEQQAALHSWVDGISDDFQNGRVPRAWLVEPDPV